jgi:hypothetical protein
MTPGQPRTCPEGCRYTAPLPALPTTSACTGDNDGTGAATSDCAAPDGGTGCDGADGLAEEDCTAVNIFCQFTAAATPSSCALNAHFSACAVAGSEGVNGYNCVFTPAVAAGAAVPETCIEDVGLDSSSVSQSSVTSGDYPFCVGDPRGWGLDVVCKGGTSLIDAATTTEKGRTAVEQQTNCCAGPLDVGGDCGGSDWCKKGLYCNEDLGMFSDNACELCPCNPGVACGLRSDGDGQPALPCGALNLLGDECGDEHGGCAPGTYCDDSGWFSSFECITGDGDEGGGDGWGWMQWGLLVCGMNSIDSFYR